MSFLYSTLLPRINLFLHFCLKNIWLYILSHAPRIVHLGTILRERRKIAILVIYFQDKDVTIACKAIQNRGNHWYLWDEAEKDNQHLFVAFFHLVQCFSTSQASSPGKSYYPGPNHLWRFCLKNLCFFY